MATYYGTYGQKVQYLASDPSDPQIGQVWYNSTSAILKVRQVTTAGAWATGGNLNNGRVMTSVTGTQTASVINGGATFPPFWTLQDATENYNGTSWTASGAPGTARYAPFLVGTQTVALGGAGADPGGNGFTSVQYYDGATWTSAPSITTGRSNLGCGGTQTSAVIFGGAPNTTATEEFDGTSWTSGGALGTSRYQLQGNNVGLQTASLCIGGFSGSALTNVESYNGTSWTTITSLPSARGNQARFGTQTLALSCGGGPGTPPGTNADVNFWNGTSWSAETSISTGTNTAAGCGTAGSGSSGLITGKGVTASTTSTEEWTGPGAGLTKTVTVS